MLTYTGKTRSANERQKNRNFVNMLLDDVFEIDHGRGARRGTEGGES